MLKFSLYVKMMLGFFGSLKRVLRGDPMGYTGKSGKDQVHTYMVLHKVDLPHVDRVASVGSLTDDLNGRSPSRPLVLQHLCFPIVAAPVISGT